MNTRIWGIIGGVALVLALLSPLVLGSAQKVERLFEAAEALYERSDHKGAIVKYKEALKESKKFGAKTEQIDKDFTTLVNLRIARCYYELAENSSDVRHYQSALMYIEEVVLDAQVVKHQEELTYLWAETLYEIGKLDQANSKFSWLIEQFPNSQWAPNALYVIGAINYEQQNYDTACKTFQKLIAEFPHSELKAEAERRIAELTLLCNESRLPVPDSCQSMYEAASNLQRQGKVHDADQGYTDLIARCPESEYITDAYIGKAEIYLEAEDYVKAREYYEAAMYSTTNAERTIELHEAYHRTYLVPEYADPKRQHGSSDELFVKARLLRKEKRFLEAAEIYEKLTNNNLSAEDIVYALYWAGRCYHEAALTNSSLFNKSVSAFKRLIGNYSSGEYTIEAYYHLSSVYVDWAKTPGNTSKCQLAINTVEEANEKYTDSDEVKNRGWLSRMQEIKKIVMPKLELPPLPPPPPVSDPGPLVDQGYVHLGSGELEEATEMARHALNLDPNYESAHTLLLKIKQRYYGLGWTFFDEEQYNRAIIEFRSAINIDPEFKKAHNHLGVVYIKQEKYTEAIHALKKAINIDERFKEAYFNLALACLELGEFECARKATNEALRIYPNYEPARILLEFITD